jgi:hypothetical protein
MGIIVGAIVMPPIMCRTRCERHMHPILCLTWKAVTHRVRYNDAFRVIRRVNNYVSTIRVILQSEGTAREAKGKLKNWEMGGPISVKTHPSSHPKVQTEQTREGNLKISGTHCFFMALSYISSIGEGL